MTDRETEIQARHQAASPGPWDPRCVLHLSLADDVEFAAHARADIPYLLGRVATLTEERDAWGVALLHDSEMQAALLRRVEVLAAPASGGVLNPTEEQEQ